MATLMPKDTAGVLGPDAGKCESRSLFLDRFADPAAKDSGGQHPRRDWFNTLLKKPAVTVAGGAQHEWQAKLTANQSTQPLYAQVQSRLMVNMAGGVMENAGLCLDRFGLPYVPGSAVKGCARRAALAALREWCETDQKPGATGADNDNLFAAACQGFNSPAAMLAAIARVFGWGEQDWISDTDKSDFAWAGGKTWESIGAGAWAVLGGAPTQDTPSEHGRGFRGLQIKNFAGSVSFLTAYPIDLDQTGQVDGLSLAVPPLGKLELDVVTCHHGNYYAEPDRAKKPHEWGEWNRQWGTAPDTEEPVPVVFPAVAAGHVFTFVLAPLRGGDAGFVTHARVWLKTGLETFGLGAKTNAGYGWFKDVTDFVTKALQSASEKRELQLQRQQEEERRKAEEVERLRKAQERKAATASMTPEAKADYELAQLTEDQFRGRLDQFAKREKSEQEAMVRALRLPTDQAGSRRPFWDVVKSKAQKGGKPAQIEQAIRQLSKQMFPGKEGKMP